MQLQGIQFHQGTARFYTLLVVCQHDGLHLGLVPKVPCVRSMAGITFKMSLQSLVLVQNYVFNLFHSYFFQYLQRFHNHTPYSNILYGFLRFRISLLFCLSKLFVYTFLKLVLCCPFFSCAHTVSEYPVLSFTL